LGQGFCIGAGVGKEEQKTFETKLLNERLKETLIGDYMKAKKRLILLDYDGVLTPFTPAPEAAAPNKETLYLLDKLAKDPANELVIISGRDRKTLGEWFENIDIEIVAEHGVWIRGKNKEWAISRPLNKDWKNKLQTILARYVDRVPGSFIEEKEYALAWHYRKADVDLASLRAKELTDNLLSMTANIDLQVLQGNKVVEVRNAGINKGSAAIHYVANKEYDYIMAVGDDWTDEDMFKALPATAYTLKVGMNPSHARYNIHNCREVQKLLESLTRIDNSRPGEIN
jgi:trehalose 6-phosphate synthase/phosphatase